MIQSHVVGFRLAVKRAPANLERVDFDTTGSSDIALGAAFGAGVGSISAAAAAPEAFAIKTALSWVT